MEKALRLVSRISLIALVLVLVSGAGMSQAQQPEPAQQDTGGLSEVEAVVASRLPIQGRLTDNGGNPLNGTYTVDFYLYDSLGGSGLVCKDDVGNDLPVVDGLFSWWIVGDCGSDDLNGQQLYLQLVVEGQTLSPRTPLYPVPYAFSLRPGAEIEAISSDSLLQIVNNGSGEGLWATSLTGEGVHGASGESTGVGGYSLTGTGVHGQSLSGPALVADGTGIIQSSAKSYLWISGNDLRPFHQDDSTVIDLDTIGGAIIYRGADTGRKNVMLPITVPGQLYGQDVKVTGLRIDWVGDTTFEAITAIILRKQTGVCRNCYKNLYFNNSTSHGCEDAVNPQGCSLNFDLTQNNVLSSNRGILYLTLELDFSSPTTYIQIGGVRLTLEHE